MTARLIHFYKRREMSCCCCGSIRSIKKRDYGMLCIDVAIALKISVKANFQSAGFSEREEF